MTYLRWLVVLMGMLPVLGYAQDAPKKPWEAAAELGLVITTGNTDTKNLNAKFNIANEQEKWRHSARFELVKAQDDGDTTAERYLVTGKTLYRYTKFNYAFATATYDDDRFSGFDYRVSEAIGYGRRLLSNDTVTLDLEIGPGARQSKVEGEKTNNDFIARAASTLAWSISQSAKFTEELSTEYGENADAVSKSLTSLKTTIAGNLSMNLSLLVKHSTEVPPGVEKVDTETSVTLVYNF